jgi:plasmid stabilization system protein ParE
MSSLKIQSLAFDDLRRLRNFLRLKDRKASSRVTKKIREHFILLKKSTYLGSRYYNYRKLVVPFGHSAYIIIYSYDDVSDCVYILRVFHSRENIDLPDPDQGFYYHLGDGKSL